MTKEHEQMMDMVRSAMEIAESRGNYAASVRLLFDATVDVMQLEVNGKVSQTVILWCCAGISASMLPLWAAVMWM